MTSSYANYNMFCMIEKQQFDNILRLLRYINKLLDVDFNKRLSEVGLTAQQGRIFLYVHRETVDYEKEIHQNDIENEFHLSKSTVSGLVKRLEKRGVISIEKQHPYVIIKSTPQGEDIIIHLRESRKKVINRLLKDMNEKEKEELMKLLEKMIENMGGGQCLCGKR